MEIALRLDRGPRQQEFLDYLNSALRGRLQSHSGTAGQDANGTIFSEVVGKFAVDQGHVDLKWRLERNADGALTRLLVEPIESGETVNWQPAAYEFTTSALTATLADKKERFFRRSFFFYIGPSLDGEYWLPGYRFAPALPKDAEPFLLNAERVVCIDQNVMAIDAMHAFALAEEAARRHAARLSLLLNVGLYESEHTIRWVLPREQPATTSVRCHVSFSSPEANLTQMPQKGIVCEPGRYVGNLAARYRVAGELQSLPSEARKILRGITAASPLVSDAFDRAARLYQVASVCGRLFPSVGLAYRVAAVEAISTADPTCNGFSQFMRKYVSSTKDVDEILEYLYGYARSGHFHSGVFPMGEFSRGFYFDPLMNTDSLGRDSLNRTCYELTREAIVNWMQAMVPNVTGDPEI